MLSLNGLKRILNNMYKLSPLIFLMFLLAGCSNLGATSAYSTIGISTEAKNKVIQYSAVWKISQRDAVSRIVMDKRELPVFTGNLFPLNYDELSCEEKNKNLQYQFDTNLRWIDSVNNPK